MNLPEPPSAPPGCVVRAARHDEAAGLAALLQKAFPDMAWPPDEARISLLQAGDVEETYVVECSGALVATASVRVLADAPDTGYVHWVAADPDYAGRGLGTLVSLRVLHHFRERGYRDVILDTDDHRLAAIKIYLNLGFTPEYVEDSQPERWLRVTAALQGESG